MARIAGIDIPNAKRIEAALPYIHGIGPVTSKKILGGCGVDPDKRAKDLSETEVAAIRNKIAELEIPVEGDLRRIVTQNIRRLQEINSYRGLRHKLGLPTRGQNTRTNSRTRKGKRKTVGGLKPKTDKK